MITLNVFHIIFEPNPPKKKKNLHKLRTAELVPQWRHGDLARIRQIRSNDFTL